LTDAIIQSEQVFMTGVGRSLLSLQAFCKRLNHLGITAYCVGDFNETAATKNDLLIVGSGSGESVCPIAIAKRAFSIGMKIAHIGSNMNSSLKEFVDIFVRIPTNTKLCLDDEIKSNQIMSSLFEQSLYILCDTITLMILNKKKVNITDLWINHANLE
jgi:6-phospho-3-hexuloisomerase